MNPENLNMEEITEARRKAIAASIRTIRESIMHHLAVMRKILLRMKSWLNYFFGEGP